MAKAKPSGADQQKVDKAKPSPTPFIDGSTAYDAFDESRKWLKVYFDPLDELERIARNRPSDKIDPQLPRITDGTMAAIVQEQPKRAIQQLATGKVGSPDVPEWAAVGDIVLTERLIPMYNRMGDALQKQWNMLGKAMTYGRSASYTFFTQTNGILHTDFNIPYAKDVISEKGKVFAPDSNIGFMRSWMQKRDIKAIVDRETRLQQQVKGYTSEWDLKALADWMSGGATSKPADQQTPAEKERGDGYSGGFEMITAFQKGVAAEFYSFSPNFNEAKPFRTKTSADPRGLLPLDFLYCNIDLSNPMGRGVIEISGGIQNLIDQQMQMFQFLTTFLMGPALQVWGNVDKSSLKMRPNAIWDMGANGNNKVEAFQINNQALSAFPNNYGLLKSQILNLNSSQDTSISGSNGNPSFSKTNAGVQAQEQRLGVSDNYLRKQFESWWGRESETSLNIYFAEMTSKDSIALSAQQLRELQSTPAAKFIKNDKLNINYGDVKNVVFRFRVDPASSKGANDQDQLQRLEALVTEVTANPLVINYYLAQDGKKLSLGEVYTQRFKRLGLENIDSILVDMAPDEAAAAKKAPFPIIDKPQIRLTGQVPNAAMGAALAAGGVNIPPQAAGGLSEQIDLGDVYKDPKTPANVKMAILQLLGIPVDQSMMQQPDAAAAPAGPSPAEIALKQQELHIKQQTVDQNAVKTALEVSKTAHAHTLDLHNAATAAAQPPETAEPGESASQAEPVEVTPPSASTNGNAVPLDGNHPLTPHEEEIVHELFKRGFNEQDAEQAIVMTRRGMPAAQIMQTLGAKYANR